MNVVDLGIILILIFGAIVGFKRGFTHELVSALGFFVVIVLAFLLKNPVSIFLYQHLPFFKFAGVLKGVTSLNIILYEAIAFLIVASILMILFKVLLNITNIFETLLKFTIVLTLPTKIAGMVVGIIESFVWLFIILYIVNLPMFHIDIIKESKYKDKILNNTPILSKITDESITIINEFTSLKEKYETSPNASEFNRETLDLFLKYEVISVKSVEILRDKDKLKIDNLDEILNKYKEE